MLKRLAIAFIAVAFAASTVLAAPLTAKVASVDGKNIVVTLDVDKAPAWAKKGAAIKVKTLGAGKVTEVSGKAVSISLTKAPDAKVGDAISFDKVAAGGC